MDDEKPSDWRGLLLSSWLMLWTMSWDELV